MFKKIAIAALLATVTLTQNGNLVGGYQNVEQQGLASMRDNDPIFESAQRTARETYQAQKNGQLGSLISVSKQVVAGINYKMTFQTENGEYIVVVNSQPWLQTLKVIEMKPAVTRQ